MKMRTRRKIAFLLVTVVALALLFLGALLGMGLALPLQTAFSNHTGVVFILENYAYFLGIDFAVLLFCFWREKSVFDEIRSRQTGGLVGNTPKMLLLGFAAGFVCNTICISTAILSGSIRFAWGQTNLTFCILALIAVFFQSGAEELLMRGYMLGVLKKQYKLWFAVLLNSVFFALLHVFNDGASLFSTVCTLLFGVVMSLIVVYYDSLWFCIGVHTAWNYSQNILFGLPNSGMRAEESLLQLTFAKDSLVYHSIYGVESGLPYLVLECICILLIIMIQKRKTGGHEKPVQ